MARNTTRPLAPWYRHRWPWLLAIAPTAAVIGGLFTFWLAVTSHDSMVVDDYYREGRAINQQIARDRVAQALGLRASLAAAPDAASTGASGAHPAPAGVPRSHIELTLSAARGSDWPARLELRLVHATRAERDLSFTLEHAGAGVYRSAATLPPEGRWMVQVEDPGHTWRLVEPVVTRFDVPIILQATTP